MLPVLASAVHAMEEASVKLSEAVSVSVMHRRTARAVARTREASDGGLRGTEDLL